MHQLVLRDSGGSEGILSQHLLESAVGAPQQSYGGKYLNPYPFGMAAAYLYSFARNHAFADANKRTALVVCSAFLQFSGYAFDGLSQKDVEEFVVSVATNRIRKDRAAAVLKQHSRRL
ncbi:MAG: type II toxin-antitoxin system death-on-curing family toxin [Planctomycetes bacterium]|nr:type II toxin-antitoxin system death-on-curing family toxin [Planctomycetota bacterium]